MTKTTAQVDNWHFDPVHLADGRTLDPNQWTIVRTNGVAAIISADDLIIDEPPDTGQSDLDLIIWGIGWLHAHFTDPEA